PDDGPCGCLGVGCARRGGECSFEIAALVLPEVPRRRPHDRRQLRVFHRAVQRIQHRGGRRTGGLPCGAVFGARRDGCCALGCRGGRRRGRECRRGGRHRRGGAAARPERNESEDPSVFHGPTRTPVRPQTQGADAFVVRIFWARIFVWARIFWARI